MPKYGLISKTDATIIESTLDLIMSGFNKDPILFITEIGIYNGSTTQGIKDYLNSKWRSGYYTGIDNQKDKEITCSSVYNNMTIGESSSVYHRLNDASQHFIFIDGCHCFAHVISDFFCYAPKVKTGGYLAFHDTGKHIKPFKDFQHGDKENPDAYISVRKALKEVGLFSVIDAKNGHIFSRDGCWQLIFDEADETNPAGGISVFKRLY